MHLQVESQRHKQNRYTILFIYNVSIIIIFSLSLCAMFNNAFFRGVLFNKKSCFNVFGKSIYKQIDTVAFYSWMILN